MDNRKELIEGEELLVQWLNSKKATDIKVLDDSDDIFPHNIKIYAVVHERLINVIFSQFIDKTCSIRFTYKSIDDKDINLKQFVQRLEDVSPEYTLECEEIIKGQQWVICIGEDDKPLIKLMEKH